ncbi:MAG: ATP-dependent zinc protease [Fidelibacterota bacterium]|nr:MAG: ATP-dependent zinc protease [Candidatus Neomarinimicrobiota bacterium]
MAKKTTGPGVAVKRRRKSLPVIGWREWISLPHLGIADIKAKIDTGARSSALHAFNIKQVRKDGRDLVTFNVHPYQRDTETTIHCEAPLAGRRAVRNSGGKTELRPTIETVVELFGQRWHIDLTLTSRDVMGFRMLLGRQAVRRRFVIHPGRSFLARKSPQYCLPAAKPRAEEKK